jgi:ribose transport system substrate-binding protein
MKKHIALTVSCWPGSPTVCSKKPANKEDKGTKAKLTIGMRQCNLGEPWRVQMNADVKMAADKHPEIKVVYKDAQNDTLKQRSQMEEFISAGVNLIIISPKEAAPLTPLSNRH